MGQAVQKLELNDWRFSEVWNNSLLTYGERPQVARDYMYASELGNSYIDRYLKMLGTKPTNPPNNRSLRKFQAGNIWEWIVQYVLQRAGIMKKKQLRAEVTLPGCLRVSGRLDFISGGEMDWERAEHDVAQLDLPEFISFATKKIIENLKIEYAGKELVTKVTECKSISSFVMERVLKTKQANQNHVLQNYHYLLGADEGIYDIGSIVYVCRDDCRIAENPIYKPSPHIMDRYEEDVRGLSNYYIHKELPPKEPLIIFDEAACKFNKNWKVEYSYYLTKLYKFKSPKEYGDIYGKMATSYNTTFRRDVEEKKLTDLNKSRIKEAKKTFPDWDKYVHLARQTGVLEIVEEEEENN